MAVERFRIITLNIHKGFAAGGPRRLVLSSIRDLLRDSGANVVFLQEVVGANHRHKRRLRHWPRETQLEYLADTVWPHHAYGKNAIYQHGHHGNAILSELPFVEWDNINLSLLNFSQRGFLHGTIQGGVHLICTHLGLLERERRQQIHYLMEYIRRRIPANAPLILAGDFNDWRGSAHRQLAGGLRLMETHNVHTGRCAATFPAFWPLLAMDRIYVRHFNILDCATMSGGHWRDFSDHCALVADISLQGTAGSAREV